ncbi:putative glutathione s-transferase protein [Neofusicoccum parvum]|uniref:Glutathione s-transferase protein n=1 Tax=Neofusicoccum parvum TaxID=310453 RepID=A0ACB5SJ23_9PEZI|nr:putative glutathione s-transferase protein [Neofusicoccum parvum]
MSLPIFTYDYDFSPCGRKIRLLLTLAGLPFQRVDQPPLLPRPDLESLGITYRRIPVVAIGKDIYCDTAAIVDVVQRKFKGLQPTPSDKAFEAFGAQLFNSVLTLVPAESITPAFKKDRETIYPVLSRPDFASLRPSSLGAFASTLDTIETQFLGDEPYIGGVRTLGVNQEPGFGAARFPRVHAWRVPSKALPSFPPTHSPTLPADSAPRLASLPDPQPAAVPPEEAAAAVLGAAYLEPEVDVAPEDPLGVEAGARVAVESADDAAPGAHAQVGKLRTKTFTGCWTCRSRGLKCDGRKPHCERCERSKRDCEGYGIRLHWIDPDEKGPPQGMQMRRMFDDAARQNPRFSDAFLDNTIESLDALQGPCEAHVEPFGVFSVGLNDDSYIDISTPASPASFDSYDSSVVLYSRGGSPADIPSPFAFAPDSLRIRLSPPIQPYLVSASLEERRLFDHWSSTLSGIFLPTPRVDNPFRNVFIPLALGSGDVSVAHPGHAALLHGIYAIAAFHIAETDGAKKDHSLIAVRHYKTSLAYLRACVAETGEQPEAVFATIILMVSIYLVVGNSSNWRIHVQGGRDWLRSQVASLRKGHFAPILYQLFRCLEVIGLWHDDTHLLPEGGPSGSDPSSAAVVAELPSDEEQAYTAPEAYCLDRYFGLPKPIFTALQRMQEFRRRGGGATAAEVAEVRRGVEEVRGLVAALRPSDGINERLLVHHYMVFYYACRITLAREFDGAAPAAVQRLVEECLQHLELTYSIEQAVRVCGISWPLFVTACEAEGAALRARALRMFDKGWEMGIGSIKKAARVVRRVWDHRDRTGLVDVRHRQEIMEAMGMDLLLA